MHNLSLECSKNVQLVSQMALVRRQYRCTSCWHKWISLCFTKCNFRCAACLCHVWSNGSCTFLDGLRSQPCHFNVRDLYHLVLYYDGWTCSKLFRFKFCLYWGRDCSNGLYRIGHRRTQSKFSYGGRWYYCLRCALYLVWFYGHGNGHQVDWKTDAACGDRCCSDDYWSQPCPSDGQRRCGQFL